MDFLEPRIPILVRISLEKLRSAQENSQLLLWLFGSWRLVGVGGCPHVGCTLWLLSAVRFGGCCVVAAVVAIVAAVAVSVATVLAAVAVTVVFAVAVTAVVAAHDPHPSKKPSAAKLQI